MEGTEHDEGPPGPGQPAAQAAAREEATAPIAPAGRRMGVPPWVQLVGLPLLVLFGWTFAGAASHAVIVFMIASMISLLLNPIVRSIVAAGTPRPVAVLMVFSIFLLALVVLSVVAVNTSVSQAQKLRAQAPAYTRQLDHQVQSTQRFLNRHHVHVDLHQQGARIRHQVATKGAEVSTQALNVGQSLVTILATTIFNLVLVVVVTVYMLLDAPRIGRFVESFFPPSWNLEPFFHRLEHSLVRYVRGQLLASAVMGLSAAVGLWVLGITGVWPAGRDLAIVFGVIVALTEFAPSIGPVLGAVPPIVAALFDGLGPALAVIIFFVILHQIEGHIVIPRLMGAAIAVHPLLVIFGIVAGAQILGVLGVLVVLPVLAVGRELLMFARERFVLEHWPEEQVGGADLAAAGAVAGAAGAAATVSAASSGQRTGAGRITAIIRRWAGPRSGDK